MVGLEGGEGGGDEEARRRLHQLLGGVPFDGGDAEGLHPLAHATPGRGGRGGGGRLQSSPFHLAWDSEGRCGDLWLDRARRGVLDCRGECGEGGGRGRGTRRGGAGVGSG